METIKTGTLTFHCTDNPGSMLQTYALQQAIQELGADNEIINYQKKGWKAEAARPYLEYLKRKLSFLAYPAWIPIRIYLEWRRRRFCRFQKKYIKMNSATPCGREDLPAIEKNYDRIIVGSDQVWNVNNVKVDESHFFDFVSEQNKKIAYAPSFGMDKLPEGYAAKLTGAIDDIKYLSVREKQGQKIIQDLTGREAPVVLDPTMLLTAEQWEKVVKLPPMKDYIFIYVRKRSPEIARFATELSRYTNLPIVQISGTRKVVKNIKQLDIGGADEWLGLIKNAKYVVTNSFHGMVFSILFQKQFFLEPMQSVNDEGNSRLFSLMSLFGLENRVFGPDTRPEDVPDLEYGEINRLLEEKRVQSKKFLEDALFQGNIGG